MFKFKDDMTIEAATQNVYNALANDDEKEIKSALEEYSGVLAQNIADKTRKDVEGQFSQRTEDSIMASRGARMELTPSEQKFFAEAVEKQTVEGLDETFPVTIIESIMENLANEHPLLSQIDTKYTTAAVKFIYGDPAEQTAYWDVIPADIRQILIGAFRVIDMQVSKLSGFIALPKGYFQLGPNWLANYVTTFLREVMQATLESAVVNGDGKLKPIGMMRQLSGAVDGVYPEKQAIEVTDLTPRSLAGPRALLAKEKMVNGEISFIVNPETFETVVNPLLFFQNQVSGTWSRVPLPNGENIIQSYAVPAGKAVLGNARNYLLAVAGNLDIRKYEETLAIEDADLYIAKLFAAGVAKNPNAFVVLDLSGIDSVDVPETEGPADVQKQDTINPAASDEDGNEDPEV